MFMIGEYMESKQSKNIVAKDERANVACQYHGHNAKQQATTSNTPRCTSACEKVAPSCHLKNVFQFCARQGKVGNIIP